MYFLRVCYTVFLLRSITMNILTYDIEEWSLAKARGEGSAKKYAEYDAYLDRILDVLDINGNKATFFCTGMMAVEFPSVIKRIYSRGHEIGCHSYSHLWLTRMSRDECFEDTRIAVDSLEQCIGVKVKSYRAPAFSIGKSNEWAFEVLALNGIEFDASIFPIARDYGGFPGFGQNTPCIIDVKGIHIKEFPICTTRILGREVAFSGGGYFRFFPIKFIVSRIKRNPYSMCYFHISDLIPELRELKSRKEYEVYYKEPGTYMARLSRYIKSNIGKHNAFAKMMDLIDSAEYINVQQGNQCVNWSIAPIVSL